jgi:hypothetical protein
VAYLNAISDTITRGVVSSRRQPVGIDIHGHHLRSAGGKDGVDTAAGPHAQHPVSLGNLAEDCLAYDRYKDTLGALYGNDTRIKRVNVLKAGRRKNA